MTPARLELRFIPGRDTSTIVSGTVAAVIGPVVPPKMTPLASPMQLIHPPPASFRRVLIFRHSCTTSLCPLFICTAMALIIGADNHPASVWGVAISENVYP